MPFGHWKDFDACVDDIRSKNPKYSDEVVHKVCGKLKHELEKASLTTEETYGMIEKELAKLFESSKPSPTKKDLKEVAPVVKAWEFDPQQILSSDRKVNGTFHVPKVDKDNEIITKGAMDNAIPDFIHLPILHDFHKERVLGLITKIYEEAGAYHFEALFKATPDVDDAWDKVKKGQYDHVSIYGSRLHGSASCGLNPQQRSEPCISHAIRLDSISACDVNARNDSTSLSLAKSGLNNDEIIEKFLIDGNDIFIKAETTSSGLIHGTWDGVKSIKESEEAWNKEERIPPTKNTRFKHTGTRQAEKDYKPVEKGSKDSQIRAMERERETVEYSGRDIGGSYDVHRHNRHEARLASGVGERRKPDSWMEKGSIQENRSGRGDLRNKGEHHRVKEDLRQNERPSGRAVHKCECGREIDKGMRDNNSVKYEGEPGNWRNSPSNSVAHQTKKLGVSDPWNAEEDPVGYMKAEEVKKMRVREVDEKEEEDDEETVEKGGVEKASSVESMFSKILETLNKLVSSDKKVHSEMEKSGEGEDEEKGTLPENRRGQGNLRNKVVTDHGGGDGGWTGSGYGRNETLRQTGRRYEELGHHDKIEEKASALMSPLGFENKRQFGTKPSEGSQTKFEPNKPPKRFKKGEELDWMKRKEGEAASGRKEGVSGKEREDFSRTNRFVEKSKTETGYYEDGTRLRKGDTMEKNEEVIQKAPEQEMTDEQFVQEIVKANLPKTDEIVKAALEKQSSEIMKALDEKFKALEEKIKKIEEQPIAKAAVVIPEQAGSTATNYGAIEKFSKGA